MPADRKCTVPDCHRPHYCRGYCSAHYRRWYRHGDTAPDVPVMAPGAPMRFLQEAMIYEGPECLPWPFSRNDKGYARVFWNGRMRRVNRMLCTWKHGPPPTREHESAHWCQNHGCINPNHLRWATSAENKADMRQRVWLIRFDRLPAFAR